MLVNQLASKLVSLKLAGPLVGLNMTAPVPCDCSNTRMFSEKRKNHVSLCGAKAGRVGVAVIEKLTADIPFVGSIISLARMVGEAGYNVLVLKAMAKHVIAFETMCPTQFANELSLEITKLSAIEISVMKQRHGGHKNREKKIAKDIEKLAKEYTDNATKLIASGRGEAFYMMALRLTSSKATWSQILARISMIKPVKGNNKKASAFKDVELQQLQELTIAIGKSKEAQPVLAYFKEFGSSAFVEKILSSAKDKVAELM